MRPSFKKKDRSFMTMEKDNGVPRAVDVNMNGYLFWRWFNKFSNSIHNLGSILLAFVLVAVIYQIVSRICHVRGFDIVELTSYMLIWIVFSCIPGAHRRGKHIKVDLIYARLTKRSQYFLDIFAGLIGISFSIIVSWQGILLTIESYEVQDVTQILHIPMWLIDIALPLGMTFFAMESAEKVFKACIQIQLAKSRN